jgi:hypothetical protein
MQRLPRAVVKLLIRQLIGRKLPKKEVDDLLDYYDWIMDGLAQAADLCTAETEPVAVYRAGD